MARPDSELQLTHLNSTMDVMINFVPNLFTVLGEDAKDKELVEKHVGDLRAKLAKLITQEHKYRLAQPALRDTQMKVNEAVTNEKFNTDVEAIYNKTRNKIKNSKEGVLDVANHPKMKKFERMIYQQLSKASGDCAGDDDDLMMTSVKCSIVDPFTQRVMTDPVKNSYCQHSYEKATILEMIERRSLKCPMPGCPNINDIHVNHLVDNIELKRYIEKSLRNKDDE